MDAKRVGLPAAAALLLGASPWITWWTMSITNQIQDVEVRVSLFSTTACDGGHCVSASVPDTWSGVAGLTMLALFVVALATAALAMRRTGDRDDVAIARLVRLAARATLVAIVVATGWAMIDLDGTPSLGPLLASTGAGLAIYAAAHDPFAMPVAAVGGPTLRARASSELRFACATGSIEEGGLRAGDRLLAWGEIARVIVRRLPPDPPWEKASLLDLVPDHGPPVRLVSTSRIDWSTLPGGAGPTMKENWRRLVAHARAANPAIEIDPDSAPFLDGREAPMFAAWKLFLDYDARYPIT
jgi:hypothetical protein